MKKMKKEGISIGIHYECCHLMKPYNRTHQPLPKSEWVGIHTISLPFHENLTKTELKYVVEKVNEFGYIREEDVALPS